jgi:hypothetical protein
VIDSDWGLLVVEPLGAERIAELFEAASPRTERRTSDRKLWARCAKPASPT